MQLSMWLVCIRVIDWTSTSTPHQCVYPPASSSWWDALDLIFNARSVGWHISPKAAPPHPHMETSVSRRSFALRTLPYFILSLTIYDVAHHAVQLLGPDTFGSSSGGSIYDSSLPPLQRYLRSGFITLLCGFVFWGSIDALYSLASLFGVLVLRMEPVQWPPMSHQPWVSESIAEFWGKRWHQTFRRTFVAVAGRPLSYILGRVGLVMGSFAMSGLMHDGCSWPMGQGTDYKVQIFFVMMGVGCILEGLFEWVSGWRVGGWVGWMWTMGWTLGWGQLMVERYLLIGLGGSRILPEELRVGKGLVEVIRGYVGWR